MGIRYCAYAFDADQTAIAVAGPRSVISDDPLADAWGFPHGAREAETTFEQSVPEVDMLYLDKAWPWLQRVTAPSREGEPPRAAYRMFEGSVTMTDHGWIPWVRTIIPDEVDDIARDISELYRSHLAHAEKEMDMSFKLQFLQRAVEFVAVDHRMAEASGV